MRSLLKQTTRVLGSAGLRDAVLVSSTPDQEDPLTAEVVFRVGPMSLCFSREYDQTFLSVASGAAPDRFFQFVDLAIALGWRTIAEVIESFTEPEPIKDVLRAYAEHRSEVEHAFSGAREQLSRARLERASHDRAHAWAELMRRKARDSLAQARRPHDEEKK